MSFKKRYFSDQDSQDSQDYVYHYSNQKFNEIKNRKMLNLPAPSAASDPEKYNTQVSLLPSPLSTDIIKKYRSNGFTSWGSGPIYEYKISIIKNAAAFDKEISLTNTPDQFDYQKIHSLDKAMNLKNIDRQKAINDDKYYNSIKKEYSNIKQQYHEDMDKYINNKISPNLTPQNYSAHLQIKKIKKVFNYWVDYNLKYGNKSQYASYIPHLHTKITKPLYPETITKLI